MGAQENEFISDDVDGTGIGGNGAGGMCFRIGVTGMEEGSVYPQRLPSLALGCPIKH